MPRWHSVSFQSVAGQQNNPGYERQDELSRCLICGAFTPWKLRFKQSSLSHTDRVLRSMESTTSSINRFSVVLYFPLAFRLISGNTDDPQVFTPNLSMLCIGFNSPLDGALRFPDEASHHGADVHNQRRPPDGVTKPFGKCALSGAWNS